jgi:ribosomal protein L29
MKMQMRDLASQATQILDQMVQLSVELPPDPTQVQKTEWENQIAELQSILVNERVLSAAQALEINKLELQITTMQKQIAELQKVPPGQAKKANG